MLTHANLLYTAGAVHRSTGPARRRRRSSSSTCLWPTCSRGWSPSSRSISAGRWPSGVGTRRPSRPDIAEAKPTHIPTVPRLLEKILTRVISHRRGGRRCQGRDLQARALTGEKVAKAKRDGGKVSPLVGRATRSGTSSRCRRSSTPSAQRPGPDHRRGADRHRGHRVLLRLRRARARGLRHDRDVRRGDAEHRRARCRSARRPAAGGHGGLARRRRRGPRTRPARVQGLPPQRRSHRAAIIEATAGCTPATSARSSTASSASRAARRT